MILAILASTYCMFYHPILKLEHSEPDNYRDHCGQIRSITPDSEFHPIQFNSIQSNLDSKSHNFTTPPAVPFVFWDLGPLKSSKI